MLGHLGSQRLLNPAGPQRVGGVQQAAVLKHGRRAAARRQWVGGVVGASGSAVDLLVRGLQAPDISLQGSKAKAAKAGGVKDCFGAACAA